jgi:GNAT superfamily N-acetyltransferase
VEIAVDSDYRKLGIGSQLYKARFNLAKRLGVIGFYAGGMLMGYHQYKHLMSVQEYAKRVASGEINDPTVSLQMHRGFQPRGIIENYLHEPDAGNTAMLIVWDNPEFERLD